GVYSVQILYWMSIPIRCYYDNNLSNGRTEMNATELRTLSGRTILLPSAEIEHFAAQIGGQVLRAEDDGYDSALVSWNAMIDKRPALIVRCATTPDVVRAVNFARD